MRGGNDEFDDLGREVPEYEITRWTDGGDWYDGEPSESILRDHIGDPDSMMTVHFPDWDSRADHDAYYQMVGGFKDWDDFEVAVVDMYVDYG